VTVCAAEPSLRARGSCSWQRHGGTPVFNEEKRIDLAAAPSRA
jgi:hypothetical protein